MGFSVDKGRNAKEAWQRVTSWQAGELQPARVIAFLLVGGEGGPWCEEHGLRRLHVLSGERIAIAIFAEEDDDLLFLAPDRNTPYRSPDVNFRAHLFSQSVALCRWLGVDTTKTPCLVARDRDGQTDVLIERTRVEQTFSEYYRRNQVYFDLLTTLEELDTAIGQCRDEMVMLHGFPERCQLAPGTMTAMLAKASLLELAAQLRDGATPTRRYRRAFENLVNATANRGDRALFYAAWKNGDPSWDAYSEERRTRDGVALATRLESVAAAADVVATKAIEEARNRLLERLAALNDKRDAVTLALSSTTYASIDEVHPNERVDLRRLEQLAAQLNDSAVLTVGARMVKGVLWVFGLL